jgi:hypothetical protein
MAKRKPVKIESKTEVVDTGIYREVRATTPLNAHTFDAFCDAILGGPDEYAQLDEVQRAAELVLEKYGGAGKHRHAIPKTFPKGTKPCEIAEANDARQVLLDIAALRATLDGRDDETKRLLVASYLQGTLPERMRVRPFEPHAGRAIRRITKQREQHRKLVVEPAKQRAAEFMQRFNALIARQSTRGTKASVTKAIKAVAEDMGIGTSTGWSYYRKKSL